MPVTTTHLTLPNGFSMPAIGYGTWQAKDELLEEALDKALEAGYRLIDTAYAYENEHVIGRVLKKWFDSGKLKREDIFITTKLPIFGIRAEDVEKYITESLSKLQLTYLDLYLVHVPCGVFKIGDKWESDPSTDLIATWKEMEKQVDAGRTKYIGVSNFNQKQVQKILDNSRIRPVNNQIELTVYLQQEELVDFLQKNNITVTSYSTLGTPGSQQVFDSRNLNLKIPNIMDNAVVKEIAQKHGKSPAQVLLKQALQRNVAVIPKSTNAERLRQNLDLAGFTLDSDDLAKLKALNINKRILEFKDIFPILSDHPEYPF